MEDAFAKADNILATAAKGIAEIITVPGYINVDFADVETVMRNSGVALMGTGIASGVNRAIIAVEEALNSPLLNNNDILGARNILLNITSGSEEITMDEIGEITDFIQEKAGNSADLIWGNGVDQESPAGHAGASRQGDHGRRSRCHGPWALAREQDQHGRHSRLVYVERFPGVRAVHA